MSPRATPTITGAMADHRLPLKPSESGLAGGGTRGGSGCRRSHDQGAEAQRRRPIGSRRWRRICWRTGVRDWCSPVNRSRTESIGSSRRSMRRLGISGIRLDSSSLSMRTIGGTGPRGGPQGLARLVAWGTCRGHARRQGRRLDRARRQPALQRSGRSSVCRGALIESRFASTWASTTTRPACIVTGTCRRRTIWNRGGTFGRLTARCRSFSR